MQVKFVPQGVTLRFIYLRKSAKILSKEPYLRQSAFFLSAKICKNLFYSICENLICKNLICANLRFSYLRKSARTFYCQSVRNFYCQSARNFFIQSVRTFLIQSA